MPTEDIIDITRKNIEQMTKTNLPQSFWWTGRHEQGEKYLSLQLYIPWSWIKTQDPNLYNYFLKKQRSSDQVFHNRV